MELDDVYKEIQHIVADLPLLLIGSGASVAHGIPNMDQLGQHLLAQLGDKFSEDRNWKIFEEHLLGGVGLEQALTGIEFEDNIIADIKRETWKLISEKDQELFYRLLESRELLPMGTLLKYLYSTSSQKVDVITTNYDRIIEYACDQERLHANLGFAGIYRKYYSGEFSNHRGVNILKVHGSLDTFRDSNSVSVALPMSPEIVSGMMPEIIAPGDAKYKEILQGSQREILSEADKRINQATGFLCIGYGFNDKQVQENIINRIRGGIPVIVLTKKVTDMAWDLLQANAKHFICIQEGAATNSTEIYVNQEMISLEGKTLWTIDGFMEIIA